MQEEFIGLDIGSNSLKAVQLERKGGQLTLKGFGYHPTPPGAIYSDAEADKKQLSKFIRELVSENRLTSPFVVAAFPESMIFTRVIEVPAVDERELSGAIEWQAEQYIPMPLSEIQLSWMVLDKDILEQARKSSEEKKPKVKILLVAAPNSLVERYVSILEDAGLQAIALETEIVAIARSMTLRATEHLPTTLLISIGASTTDLAVVNDGIIQFTRSIGTGGTAFARSISQELGFDMNQAEEYKKAYGLLEDHLEGKILKVIRPVVDVVVNEVERAIMFFQTHNPTTPVKRVVLTGGTSQLPGLVLYLANTLGLEVQIGNPWENIVVPTQFKSKTDQVENQVSYAVAVGLAMRDEHGN